LLSNTLLTAAGSSSQLLLMVAIFAVMYFLLIAPQRKREKQLAAMRAQLEVGDEIVTQGGIIGRVVSIRDDTVVIETGSDRSKIRIVRWAIQDNVTKKAAGSK
jgi:preprotein translocase subunit YajC